MLSRQIGKILRGKATPFQLASACVLGSMIGFVPGVFEGPGVVAVVLVLALVIINANLMLAGLVAGGCKLLALLGVQVLFLVGRAVLDGPLQGPMRTAINAPVLAWLGLEYYVTTGGIVVGFLLGLVIAGFVIATVGVFRARMARLEEGSELYRKYTSKWWVKALAWIFLGKGKGKATYAELAKKKIGLPIRPLGVALAFFLAVLAYVLWSFQNEWLVREAAVRSLQTANGATVDITSARLDLAKGELRLTGLAMADISDLKRDRLRAKEAAATLGTRDLLRKRLVIDSIELTEASTGEPRLIPGRRFRLPIAQWPKAAARSAPSIDDLLKEPEVWRERLETIGRWLEDLSRRLPDEPADPTSPVDPDDDRETLRERLAREAKALGYANVRALHLVEGSPRILVKAVVATGVKTPEADNVTLVATNLASEPWLVDDPARIRFEIAQGRFAELTLAALARGAAASATPVHNAFRWRYTKIDADKAASLLKSSGSPVLKGGTVDLLCERGRFAQSPQGQTIVSFPVAIVVRNTVITIDGAGSAPIEKIAFPVRIHGALSDPSISINHDALAKALTNAGAAALAAKVRERAQAEIDKAVGKVGDQLADKLADKLGDDLPIDLGPATDLIQDAAGDSAKDLIGNLLGNRPKKDDKKPDPPK